MTTADTQACRTSGLRAEPTLLCVRWRTPATVVRAAWQMIAPLAETPADNEPRDGWVVGLSLPAPDAPFGRRLERVGLHIRTGPDFAVEVPLSLGEVVWKRDVMTGLDHAEASIKLAYGPLAGQSVRVQLTLRGTAVLYARTNLMTMWGMPGGTCEIEPAAQVVPAF